MISPPQTRRSIVRTKGFEILEKSIMKNIKCLSLNEATVKATTGLLQINGVELKALVNPMGQKCHPHSLNMQLMVIIHIWVLNPL